MKFYRVVEAGCDRISYFFGRLRSIKTLGRGQRILERRILMLSYEFPPIGGGMGNANYCLLREFARSLDLRSDLVTSSATDALEEIRFADAIRVFRLPVGKRQPHFWTAAEIWRWFILAQTIGWSKVADAYLRLYEQVLDPGAKKATSEFSSSMCS